MIKVKSESEAAQLCPTHSDPRDCSIRLLCPWDFPGRSTGVGCHCLLQGKHSFPLLTKTLNHHYIPMKSDLKWALKLYLVWLCKKKEEEKIKVIMFKPSMGVRHELEKPDNLASTNRFSQCSFIMRNSYFQFYVLETHSWAKYCLNQMFLIQSLQTP